MNCKEFHHEVEAGLRDTRLSASAQHHAADCPPCHEFNNEHIEFREWMTVCEKITAPKDFQFGVQRKIANASSAHTNDGIWRSLRYIVPSAGMAAVLALGISYTYNYQNVDSTGATAAMANSQQASDKPAAPVVIPVDNTATQQQNTVVVQAPVENEKPAANVTEAEKTVKEALPKNQEKITGGSIESTVKDKGDAKLPEGIHVPASGAESRSKMLMSLPKLGMTASTDLKVNRVIAGSAAERAGIQVGDQIVSVNGSTVTVNRGGQTMTFTLK